jgi:hypothetical protein
VAAGVLIAAIAVVAAIVQEAAEAQPAIPHGAIRVDVGTRPESRPVPPGFVGFSIEYRSAPGYFGTDPSRPDPLFIALVRALDPGQSPVLRFGGDTTDWSWWPTPGVAMPGGIRYTLGPGWVQSTRAMARALNARLILGINFEADRRAIAATEASQLLDGIGRQYIAGFELGNEPEVYGTLGWYETAAGAPVPGRPSSYALGPYLRDYRSVSAALPRAVPIAGPASGAPAWLAGLHRYLAANPRVGLVTYHRYPLHRCFTARNSPDFPTIGNLLAPVASSGPATSLAHAVATAHARGLPLRADELNSVSCGGARGVSDTFASALWVLDTLFNMARVGVDGVNLHTFQKAVYEPFAFAHGDAGWTAEVRPLYYGLLAFTRAAPPGSRLLPASFAGPSTLRVWATRARGGPVRAVAINDAPRSAAVVAIRAPTTATAASVQFLRASGLGAKTGVTLGGRSFGASTQTGALTGIDQTQQLTAVDGRFVVRVPPASAALIVAAPR